MGRLACFLVHAAGAALIASGGIVLRKALRRRPGRRSKETDPTQERPTVSAIPYRKNPPAQPTPLAAESYVTALAPAAAAADSNQTPTAPASSAETTVKEEEPHSEKENLAPSSPKPPAKSLAVTPAKKAAGEPAANTPPAAALGAALPSPVLQAAGAHFDELDQVKGEAEQLRNEVNYLQAHLANKDDELLKLQREAELLKQELEGANTLCAKLDDDIEKYAEAYAEAMMAAKAAQAETAVAHAWIKQAEEELEGQDCTIRDLKEAIRRSSETAPTVSDPDRRIPKIEPQAVVNADFKAMVPMETGLQLQPTRLTYGLRSPIALMADLTVTSMRVDGGAAADFDCDPKWSYLRDEGAAAGWLINPAEILLGRKLGIGAYGTVYEEATFRDTAAVVKRVNIRHADSEEQAKQITCFLREVETLSCLRDPHILPFFGACMRSYDECWLVTEFLPGGDLSQWLHGNGGWAPKRSVEEKLKMAVGVAKGMKAMHEAQPSIIHRDLKPSNVLIDAKGQARVADMGLARHLRHGDDLTGETGTYQYMAPEVLDGHAYDCTADVYSFGIMLWEIAMQEKPYACANLKAAQVARQVADDDDFRPSLENLPRDVPSAVWTICQRCWYSCAELRPPFCELVKTLEAIQREQGARSQLLLQ